MNAPGPAEGLLERIGDQALDDDYYEVRTDPPTRLDRVLTAIALGVFAMTITVAAVQTRVDRPATEREQQALADDVVARQNVQDSRIAQVEALRSEVADLTASADLEDPAIRSLLTQSGGVALRGPGLTVTVDPAASDGGFGDVRDSDLQMLVNGLWAVGAEAVSINDERIGPTTSIRFAGGAITVNYQTVAPPYVLRAIGDDDSMERRLEDSQLGQSWRDRAADTSLTFRIRRTSDVRIGAIGDDRLVVNHAERTEEDR